MNIPPVTTDGAIVVHVGPYCHPTARGDLYVDRQLNPALLAMLVAAFSEYQDVYGARWGAAHTAEIAEGHVTLHQHYGPPLTFRPTVATLQNLAGEQP